MPKFRDLTGIVFDRLTVVSLVEGGKYARWLCRCSCGVETIKTGKSLKDRVTRSCGCLRRETSAAHAARMAKRHGYALTPTWSAWRSMRRRCAGYGESDVKNYASRGIEVCERWRDSFANFLADMGARPLGTSIDRINNDGNYEPGNCRWADAITQGNNKRSNVFLEYGGERLTVSQWAAKLGVLPQLIRGRIGSGWSVQRALTEPIQTNRRRRAAAIGEKQ